MAATTVRRRVRRWSDWLHHWLGFSAGAVLVVIGLSGSLLAFYMEIERSWYPHLQTADPHARPSSYEAIYQTLADLRQNVRNKSAVDEKIAELEDLHTTASRICPQSWWIPFERG